jgi:hypothetical protein
MKLLEAGCGDLSLSGAVPPGQQPGSTCTQNQLIGEGHGGQQDDQSGQSHEDGEAHAPSIRGEARAHADFGNCLGPPANGRHTDRPPVRTSLWPTTTTTRSATSRDRSRRTPPRGQYLGRCDREPGTKGPCLAFTTDRVCQDLACIVRHHLEYGRPFCWSTTKTSHLRRQDSASPARARCIASAPANFLDSEGTSQSTSEAARYTAPATAAHS